MDKKLKDHIWRKLLEISSKLLLYDKIHSNDYLFCLINLALNIISVAEDADEGHVENVHKLDHGGAVHEV